MKRALVVATLIAGSLTYQVATAANAHADEVSTTSAQRKADKHIPAHRWTKVYMHRKTALGVAHNPISYGNIVPEHNGWGSVYVYVNFRNQSRDAKYCVRFVRVPGHDDTGTTCFYGGGSNQYSHAWGFYQRTATPVSVEVWSARSTTLDTTQFKMAVY